MSKRAASKENSSEESIDLPIRRSSRISLNQNSVSSPLPTPKSIGTRRGSASSTGEKNKGLSRDISPAEITSKRKTRRASTEEELKSTPIKTRRGSISKLIDEDKKGLSSPNTPSRRIITRAVSTSPSGARDIPARRTRRSISASQDNEVLEEQVPLRRSTRRRSSADTQEDAFNEDLSTKSKPTTRRRRSSSIDESEEITKNDVKPRTKRLYSEDNQLEPIEEHETEDKLDRKTDKTNIERVKDNDLSVIEESEDAEVEKSNTIIKAIDDVLINKDSTIKCKVVIEKTKSIFSPLTPKPNNSDEKVDDKVLSSAIDRENKFHENHQNDSMEIDSLNTSPLKKYSEEEPAKNIEKTANCKISNMDNAKKSYITSGSDDSFVFSLNRSIDKTQTPTDETDDEVFGSPGSNKENNCTNITPNKTKKQVNSKENKSRDSSELELEVNVFQSNTSSHDNFNEPMEVDSEVENVKDSSKMNTPKSSDEESMRLGIIKTTTKIIKEPGDPEISDNEKVTSSDDAIKLINTNDKLDKSSSKDEVTTKISLRKSSENVIIKQNEIIYNSHMEVLENDKKFEKLNASCSSTTSNSAVEQFTSSNSNGDDKINSSLNNSPNVSFKERKDSSASSDYSIKLVDSEEEQDSRGGESDIKEKSQISKQHTEGNSISESETTISAHTNTSMKESENEEIAQEVNESSIKEHTESFVVGKATYDDSPKKKQNSNHQAILLENSSTPDNESKDEICLSSEQKDNSLETKIKQNGFEKHTPKAKSPRQSLSNKSHNKDNYKETKVDEVQNPQAEESKTKMILNTSSDACDIEELKDSQNSESEIEDSESGSSLPHKHSCEKAKQSLSSEAMEINNYVDSEQGEEVIESEHKARSRHSLNKSLIEDGRETKNGNQNKKIPKDSQLNDTIKKKRDKPVEQKLIDSTETDENTSSENLKNQSVQKQKKETMPCDENTVNSIEPSPVKVVKKQKSLKLKTESNQEKTEEPNCNMESENEKISSPKDAGRNSRKSRDNSLRRSDSESDTSKYKSNLSSNIEKAISPLKSKKEKMKACGVNFVKESPTAARIGLDEKINEKIDKLLLEKFGTLQNEQQDSQSDKNNSEDDNESMSEDYEKTNSFIDDIAEECEEDTPLEDSNDIVDEGESINSKDSDIESDDTYESDDSFLVKNDSGDLDLLSGNEYDLEDIPEFKGKKSTTRRRIIVNTNTSSEEESANPTYRVSFSDKVEIIPKEKSPLKQTTLEKATDNASTDVNLSKKKLQKADPEVSPIKAPNSEVPSVFVDLVNDSSEDDKEGESKLNETPALDETIRSLMEEEKSSTPNASLSRSANTSKQNNSLRSSSIIVHECVSVNEMKEGFLTEKLQQVVSVFCAGLNLSDGNISMNVSLDYVENAPKDSNNKKADNVEIAQKSFEEKVETKSDNKFEDHNDSINYKKNSRKRRSSNISSEKTEKESFPSVDKIEEIITAEDLSLLDASLNDENSVVDENKASDSGSAKKKRRLSSRKEKRLSNRDCDVISSTLHEKDNNPGAKKNEEQNTVVDNTLAIEEIQQVGPTKNKRKSSNKVEKSFSENEESNYKNHKSQATEKEQESSCDKRYNIEEKQVSEEESEPKMKKRKKTNERKNAEKISNEQSTTKLTTNERIKLLEMQCEELSADDLRHRLPSRKETSDESKNLTKKKDLKRLKSKLKNDLKSTMLSGLVTDVKNRPRRLVKPSTEMDTKDWLIEETVSKPSSANLSKCTFNFKKIDANDFKNQMLYDPRIKREPMSTYLRKKGYYK